MRDVRLVTGPHDAIERALAERARAAQAGAPLAPAHVPIGTTIRPYPRRRLAALLGVSPTSTS